MDPLPSELSASLPEGTAPVAAEWWASLSDAERQRIIGLWDERLDVRFFTPQADSDGKIDERATNTGCPRRPVRLVR